MATQTATFQGIPIVGLDFPLRRGSSPSTGRIRIPQIGNLSASAGDLALQAGGNVTFSDVVPDLSTLQYLNRDGKREWVMRIQDRRAAWPGKRVCGHYNKRWRDGTIDSSTRKTLSELADLALDAVQEPTGAALYDAYPEVIWDNTPANEALDQLSAIMPVHVVREDTDAYNVVQTGDGAKIADHTSKPAITPFFTFAADSGPKTIRIVCGRTWFDCALELEAVGRDTDGKYKRLDDLSYRPSRGWEKEWPTLFTGVGQWQRPFAFQSVFRCYRIKVPQTLPFDDDEGNPVTLTDLDDIEFDGYRMVQGINEEAPLCFINGTWWPYTDHFYNAENCHVYGNEPWRIDAEHRMIVFDYPVFKAGDCVEPADIDLHTSFHLRDESKCWMRHSLEADRASGTGEWVLDLPFLWRVQAKYYFGCNVNSQYDNQSKLDSELQVYLDAWKDHFDTIVNKADVPFVGAQNIDLSGNIAQLRYRIGRGLTPETRASEHYIPTM